MEDVQAEVDQRARDRLAVDPQVLLGQVPAARAHQQRGELRRELVLLAVRARVLDRALDGVDQVDVAADLVLPRRGVRVLEVGHEAARARVERVDDELAVGRPGDLHPPVAVVGRRRGDLPVARRGSRASRPGSRACRRARAPPPARAGRRAAPAGAARSARAARRASPAPRRRRCRAARSSRGGIDGQARAHGRVPRIEWSSKVMGWKTGSSRPSRCAAICSAQPGLAAAIASAPVATRLAALRARARRRRPAARGCRSRPSRSTAPSRPARGARAPGSRAAARAAAPAPSAHGRDGRRRGRRRAAGSGAAAPAARARPAAR